MWDSNYTAVWHLKETGGGAGAIKDSTASANHGTDFSSPTFGVTGKIGGAIDFDGTNDYATMPTSGFNTSAGTVELWANIDTFPPTDKKYMFSHFTPSPIANRVYVDLKPDNTWGTGMGDTYDLVRGSVVSAGTWYHLVLTWDGTNVRGYKDGVLNFGPTSYTGLTTVGNIYVSAWDGTAEWFDGTLDEVRVSEAVRSADWIQTSYNNQSNPSSFYSIGTSSCYLGGFSCNRRITIDSSKVEGSSDLTNFPFLIEIQNDCNIKSAANGGGVQNSSGWDIIFVDSDGVTQLDHEIEEYDGTNGDLTAWVRIPTLPYNSDKDIYMYYGKSDLVCDPSNPTGVWDSSYEAVYHLNESTNFQDSTSHNRDATAEDTDNYSAVIADGQNFGPQDEISIGNWNFSGDELTLQAWARFDDFDQNDPRVISKANGTSEQNHVFLLGLSGNLEQHLRMRLKTGTDDLLNTTTIVDTDDPLNDDTWYLIAGTYDGANMRLLSNGVEVHSAAKTGNLRVNSWNIALGNNPGNTSSTSYSMDGKLDEVRILSVARSANWLKTEYNNQSAPSSFYSMSQDTCGGEYGFNFQYCKKITVDHTQVSSSLTRYPLLINITGDDDLKTVANGGRVQNSQGWDIVFKTSGCVNYDHEIEKYDGVNGDLVAWVHIPTLSSSTDTEIYMYYGATAILCSTENPTAVWDARFRAVYHLNDDFNDSTQYNRDGTNYGATFTAGKIGNGVLFDPSDGYDRIELGTWDMSSDDITIQAWAWPNDFNQDDPRIVSKGSTTGSGTQDHVWQFGLENGNNGENRMRFRLKTGTVDTAGTVELEGTSPNGYLPTPQTWYHLAGTYEDDNSAGTEMRLYVNGLDAGQLGHAGNIAENAWPIWIGANPHGASSSAKSWDGVLDEVRILSSDLSQDWLETEYRNHNDPGNFYSITSCFEQTNEVTQEWVEEVQ